VFGSGDAEKATRDLKARARAFADE